MEKHKTNQDHGRKYGGSSSFVDVSQPSKAVLNKGSATAPPRMSMRSRPAMSLSLDLFVTVWTMDRNR